MALEAVLTALTSTMGNFGIRVGYLIAQSCVNFSWGTNNDSYPCHLERWGCILAVY